MLNAMGSNPTTVASEVIRIGRRRMRQACTTASSQPAPFAPQDIGKINDQDAVGDDHALQHDDAHERLNVQRRAGNNQGDNHAHKACGNREHDQEWVDEGTKLSDEDQIDQEDSKQKAKAKTLERRLHGDHEPPDVYADVRRQRDVRDDLGNLRCRPS